MNAYDAAFTNGFSSLSDIGDATDNPVYISGGALILYGLFFAALLAVVLVPAYTAWRNRAMRFRDHLYPIPADGRPPKIWYEDRSVLEDLLGANLGADSRFLAIAGVLAPLIGTIIAVAIPAIHD